MKAVLSFLPLAFYDAPVDDVCSLRQVAQVGLCGMTMQQDMMQDRRGYIWLATSDGLRLKRKEN